MKNIIKKIKKIIKHNRLNTLIAIVSVIAFVMGGLTISWLWSLIIIGGIDLLLFVPSIINKRKKTSKKKTKKTKGKKRKIIKIILIILFSMATLFLISICIFFWMIVKNAPDFDPEKLYQKEATIIYDSKGEAIAKLGAEKREKITYEEMPEVLVDAIIATEDSRFFQHNGFDLPRFAKASFGQLLGHSDAGGASTITMQIVKNHFTSTTATGVEGIMRKFTDIYLAIFKVEKKFTKKEILEFYVNYNYLGGMAYGGAYGVEQACLTYFGKSAKDINLAEAAMIAGLFQAPNSYDPYINPDLTEKRRQTVLYLMERHGYISSEERNIASDIKVPELLKTTDGEINKYQGFIDTVTAEVERLTGNNPYVVPMEIYTTMDREKQDHIYSVVSGEKFTWENDIVDAGISITNVNTGAIVAIGAGRNRTGERGFNNATMIKRQVGSTAKPLFDYGPGIEYNNWSTYTPFVDEEHTYSTNVKVENWDGKYQGFVSLRDALKASRNIPALKAFQSLSNKNIKTFVTSLGLSPEIDSGLIHEAHSIGGYNGESPLSMSAAYASFANGGYYIKPYSFTKVVYRDNGEIYEQKPKKEKVMSPSTAYMISDILVDTAKYALGSYSNVNGITYAAKTGTTNFAKETFQQFKLPSNAINDLWVAGFSPDYSIAVWYGYDKINKSYVTKFGNSQHSKLFQAVAKGVFKGNNQFQQPSNVVEIEIEKESYPAMLPSAFTPSSMIIKELFKKGTEPTEVSNRYNQLGNVNSLNSTLSGDKLTLSWEAIDTPAAVDTNKLESYFKSLYKKASDQTKYLNSRLAYNNANIGNLGYNVYIKKSDATLSLVGFTRETSFEQTITSTANPITYVVKSVYSIFKSNQSSGTELTVNFSNSEDIITSYLNGNTTIMIAVGGTYIEPNPSVIVLDNLVDVSNQSTIIKTIRRQSDNSTVTSISTSDPETYIITYDVSYESYSETYIRTVQVEAN